MQSDVDDPLVELFEIRQRSRIECRAAFGTGNARGGSRHIDGTGRSRVSLPLARTDHEDAAGGAKPATQPPAVNPCSVVRRRRLSCSRPGGAANIGPLPTFALAPIGLHKRPEWPACAIVRKLPTSRRQARRHRPFHLCCYAMGERAGVT